ncbi:FtsX-like permease family protein [Streptomyces sp. SID335]|uniref:ABC transporter permease n=2 Tax=Streptomyces TaxID=1883 RepID=A0A5P2BDH4_STRVZ|nr:FtsX-like permease family protein [Streptomyces sp. SID335]MYZ13918.1 FtsX-like permease family protein [Streptomyces sp. SID337]NDZ87243.1 ABC transporter permease [Streptomyces sp. SID10115]NDZ97914.1 ABC transporter permease [Streptomyces sp. SID10116]NEB48304.1 ABC transporter permease [Streptomyces sp. SID339]QES28565.1 ABC transporter permease [Streptomyces venezuelae]
MTEEGPMTGERARDRVKPARLSPGDILRVGAVGLRARRTRVVLSALGIAIGIATMVAVVGLSQSSKSDLMAKLDRLGTNLLTAEAGKDAVGRHVPLPKSAVAMVERIGPVRHATATGNVDTRIRRSDVVPQERTAGVTAQAARTDLLTALNARVRQGRWLDRAGERLPVTVLGSVAAERLGVRAPGEKIMMGDSYVVVVGILEPVELVPTLDRVALVGFPAAEKYFGFDGHPSMIFERSPDGTVEDVREVLARTVSPGDEGSVKVSRPSDALAAKAATDEGLTALMLGLGAVALLVGGVGVANTMVISVLERRAEIGLRRALGATKGAIRLQFLTESLLLSALGGAVGAVLGAAATYAFALSREWVPVVPPWSLTAGFAATLVIGMVAGLYPAVRAARLHPTVALNAT